MGEVSWPAFVSALRHPRLGQTGIAKKNATQHGKIKETVYFISLYIITSILCVYELLAAEGGSGGEVSWPAFVSALCHPRLGQTGIAEKIATQHGKIVETIFHLTTSSTISILLYNTT